MAERPAKDRTPRVCAAALPPRLSVCPSQWQTSARRTGSGALRQLPVAGKGEQAAKSLRLHTPITATTVLEKKRGKSATAVVKVTSPGRGDDLQVPLHVESVSRKTNGFHALHVHVIAPLHQTSATVSNIRSAKLRHLSRCEWMTTNRDQSPFITNTLAATCRRHRGYALKRMITARRRSQK